MKKNAIYIKFRTYMLIIGISTAAVFSILIAAGLFVTRQVVVSGGNRLSDSADEDTRQLLIEQAESTLATFDQDIKWIAVFAGIILIFMLIGVITLSGQLAMKINGSLEKLAIDAARIGAGDFNHVLEVKTGDELEIVVTAFNSMIDGIKTITAEKERLEIASAEKAREAQIIHEANQNLQTILNILPVGVGVMSTDDHSFLFANKAFQDVFNCTSIDQILGHSGFEFMPVIQPDGRKTMERLNDIFQRESTVTELQCIKSGGDPFIARVRTIATNFKGISASLGVIEDITGE